MTDTVQGVDTLTDTVAVEIKGDKRAHLVACCKYWLSPTAPVD